ncbi:hypothetical protein M408DRAFT_212099 [Serendipita vermifera MAFF 305830]|uniref:Uncharacterized protein n=1 Tax=Serendipita vermifera MAFF 305830 TaxID=933852 RepID=A0A0C2WFV4_SERVB|nr:hypothetical protein M408DRAFT_212099 [Serendipita vermifera MAFF 305830]
MWSLILGYIGICHTLPSIRLRLVLGVLSVGSFRVSVLLKFPLCLSSRGFVVGPPHSGLGVSRLPLLQARNSLLILDLCLLGGLLSRFLYCRHVLLSIGVRRSLVLFVVVLGFLLGCLHDYKYTTLYLRVPLAYGRRL